ncbi:uncharacterized protein LOC121877833 [Homarus americanus]|uniref:Putative Pro-resilin-like 180 n=1 Tax=Homarus americanus TaxID=6706 RepID=A0A8J5MPW6_HOMAM|nr:uncharacterized protein LOC121877833 [Homarus americanus]KAG7159157.1 putative Pro-resilin-like 180 [Homarus americanus]
MTYKTVVLTALLAATLANPDPAPVYGTTAYNATAHTASHYNNPSSGYDYSVPTTRPVQYDFNNNHQQGTNDDFNPQGSVAMLLPDGRIQRVTYSINGTSGFTFAVTFEGVAQ